MIVCSCNVISDHDVRSAVNAAADLPRNAKQIYGCLGCSAECGRCARTIKTIIDEALGACAKSCCAGCPHSQASGRSRTPTPSSRSPPPEYPKNLRISSFALPILHGRGLLLRLNLI